MRAKVYAVVPAAGLGSRMGTDIPKQYLHVAGKPVLQRTLEVLHAHAAIQSIVVALATNDDRWPAIAAAFPDKLSIVEGGEERCHSVLAAIEALAGVAGDADWVLVHDAARPCLRGQDIDRMLAELQGGEIGGVLATPVRDTLKRSDIAMLVSETVNRESLWHALTPQMFRIGALRAAIRAALERGVTVTDEAQAIEIAGGQVRIVRGHADNIKITHPADLDLAALVITAQGR